MPECTISRASETYDLRLDDRMYGDNRIGATAQYISKNLTGTPSVVCIVLGWDRGADSAVLKQENGGIEVLE